MPIPSFIPDVHYEVNNYLIFDLNISVIIMGLYQAYYISLEPVAAVSLLSVSYCSQVLIFLP